MKRFHLPLLAALPAVLSGCQSYNYINNYTRTSYPTYEACLLASQGYLAQGIPNPCVAQQVGGVYMYYGPWMYFGGGYTRVVGYDYDGRMSRQGVNFDRNGRATGRFAAPKVTRGGFSTGSRSSGQVAVPSSTTPSSPAAPRTTGIGAGGSSTASPARTPTRVIVPGSKGNRTGGSFGG